MFYCKDGFTVEIVESTHRKVGPLVQYLCVPLCCVGILVFKDDGMDVVFFLVAVLLLILFVSTTGISTISGSKCKKEGGYGGSSTHGEGK